MNLNLQLGNTLLGAVETLRMEQAHDPAGVTEQWVATLALPGPTPALREAALAALQARVGETGAALLLAGNTTLRARAVADCRVGPALTRVRAVASRPESAPALAAVEVVLDCTLQNPAAIVQRHDQTTQWVSRAGQPPCLVTRGRIVLRAGESPASAVGEIAAVPAGWRRLRAVHTRDPRVPALDYELEDELPFALLPAGVEDGQVVRSLFTDPGGGRARSTSGFFVGPGALARALELQPPAATQARITENAQLARVDFEFTELVPLAVHEGLLAQHETLLYATRRTFVDHPLLAPGLPRYRQQVGAAFTELTQHGHAVGQTSHPAPPVPLFAGDLAEREVGFSRPDSGLAADKRFVTTWRYVMRLGREIAAHAPATT